MGAGSGTRELPEPFAPEVRSVEVGDWPRAFEAIRRPQIRATDQGNALLVVLLRTITAAMRGQAHGDVGTAARGYAVAAAMLPPRLIREASPDGWCRARITPAALIALDPTPLLARVAAVIGREQALLGELRRGLSEHPKQRDHLVEACVQFQFEVFCCPYAFPPRPSQRAGLPSMQITRADMLRRATYLTQFAFPQRGDVSKAPWSDLGAPRGLWTAALDRLAERPLAPWPTDGPKALVEVRRGRRRAWEQARRRRDDLSYD